MSGGQQAISKRYRVEILKTDTAKGLIFGKAIVCTKRGKPYFDTQGDHCPDDTMVDVGADFMSNSARPVNVMHEGPDVGDVIFAMPWTPDVAKAFGLKDVEAKQAWTGLMIGARPDPDVFKRVIKGELLELSIEGKRGVDEVVEPDDEIEEAA